MYSLRKVEECSNEYLKYKTMLISNISDYLELIARINNLQKIDSIERMYIDDKLYYYILIADNEKIHYSERVKFFNYINDEQLTYIINYLNDKLQHVKLVRRK